MLDLDKIHRLMAKDSRVTLRVEVRHRNGKNGYAKYSTFRVSGEIDKHRLKSEDILEMQVTRLLLTMVCLLQLRTGTTITIDQIVP